MPCKRSFFSLTLFKKNLARFWPVWGLSSLAGAMVPLWLLLGLMSNRGSLSNHMTEDFAEMLYTAAAYVVPYITIAYAVLCAMLVWGYLMNARSVGLMHTLPADRTCLFITGTASGLAMMLIPYVVTGALTCLVALCWDFMALGAVCRTALAVILLTVAFFGIATFCAMVTGNTFMVPALYVLLNFLAPLVTSLFNSLYVNFFLGLTGTNYTVSAWLSPPIKIFQNFKMNSEFVGTYAQRSRVTVLHGWGTLALYAGAGFALLILSWFLYRLRHSESAGDVIAFSWLRPVFRYGAAFLSALTVGRLFYAVIWESFFQKGGWYDVVPMAACLFAGGVLGYYIASMMLEKSLRVFRGSLKGVGAVCAGVLVLSLWLAFDPFGLVTRVPDASDVKRVQVDCYPMSLDLRAGEDDAYIQKVVDLHQAVVNDRAYIMEQDQSYRSYDTPYDEEGRPQREYVRLTIRYTLQNGGQLERQYNMYVTQTRARNPDTFDGMMKTLVESDRAIQENTVAIPYGCELNRMSLDNELTYTEDGILPNHQREILDALERDLEAGNIPRRTLFDRNSWPEGYQLTVQMEFGALDQNNGRTTWRAVKIYPTMTETIQCLLNLTYLSQEELTELRQDYAQRMALRLEEEK